MTNSALPPEGVNTPPETAHSTEKDRIEMLAEVRMNSTGDTYEQALAEVRGMLADGARYDAERGWVWGNET